MKYWNAYCNCFFYSSCANIIFNKYIIHLHPYYDISALMMCSLARGQDKNLSSTATYHSHEIAAIANDNNPINSGKTKSSPALVYFCHSVHLDMLQYVYLYCFRNDVIKMSIYAIADEKMGVYPCLSATLTSEVPSPDISPKRTQFTRSGLARPQECPPATHPNDKPSGKRKFKSKHLCDTDEQKKVS